MQAARDPGRGPVGPGQRGREAEADEGRDDEVKRLRGVQAVGAGIAQRADDVEELDHRTGPAVQQDQRPRVRFAATSMCRKCTVWPSIWVRNCGWEFSSASWARQSKSLAQ